MEDLAATVSDTLEQLRAVLASIEPGEPRAEVDHAAYLRGALATLELIKQATPSTPLSS